MSKSFTIPENITFEFIDSNVYILDIDNGEYYKLSESASIIWKEIEKGFNIDNIKTRLKDLFDYDKNIDNDVDEVIKDLKTLKLIKDSWKKLF